MTTEQIQKEMEELYYAIRMQKAHKRTKENRLDIASMEEKYKRLAKELKNAKT